MADAKWRLRIGGWRRGLLCFGLPIVGALSSLSGCASKATPEAKGVEHLQGKLKVVEITALDFAPNLERVLESRDDTDRLERLASVVRFQLGRAEWLFQAGYDTAGLSAVSGALYLLRSGELRPEMITGHESALRLAVSTVAEAGDEGRTRALYTMLERTLPAKERGDVAAHLAALTDWQRDTVANDSMQAIGALQRSAVNRALIEPTSETYKAAQDSTVRWIAAARAFSGEERRPPETNFERDEWLEAYRAVRSGALTLAALSLRFRDAIDGVAILEQASIAPVVPPNLHDTLEKASSGHNPEAWADLFGVFEGNGAGQQPEADLDPELARGAAWGTAIELYRAEPSSLRSVIPLASLLISHQMTDAAALLLVKSLGASPDPREIGWSLHLITQALSGLETLGDLATARAVFANTGGLLKYGESTTPDVRQGVAALQFVMGEMESRSGELAKAREHVVAAIALEPTFEALRLLAAIDRQRGDAAAVVESLNRMSAISDKANDPASQAETQGLLFEVYRELGQQNDARSALESALRSALKARANASSSPEQASAERVLARILEQYGDADGARRAVERAFEASQYDARQFAATVLDSARRALTTSDLQSARNAVHRAIEGQIGEQDLIYTALWLKLLERQLKAPSDGTSEEAFARIEQRSTWPATLRDWALGKLTNQGLLAAAKNRIERAEALFYTTMAARVSGQPKSESAGLRAVVSSEAIELVEVTIARDLLARDAGLFKPTLPNGVTIP